VASYEVRAATFSVAALANDTTAWWNGATVSQSFYESVQPGATEAFLIGNLEVSNTWYFAITSKSPGGKVSLIDVNASNPGNQAFVFTRDVQPIPPTGLAVVASTSPIVVLKWDNMSGQQGYFDFNHYQILRSLNFAPFSSFASVGTSANNAFIDESVTAGVTYYYCITAIDSQPQVLVSSPSAVVSVCVARAKNRNADTTRPFPPSGVRLYVDHFRPVISWDAPHHNTDGTVCTDHATCEIYRTTSLKDAWTNVGSVPYNGNVGYNWTDTSIDLKNSAIYYYKVECVDITGNTSDGSMYCDTSPDLNLIAESGDKQVNFVVPQSESGALYRNGPNGENIDIVVDETQTSADPNVVINFEFKAITADTRQKINGFMFNKPLNKVVWQFSQNPLFRPAGSGKVSFGKTPVDIGKELSMFWNNGVDWIKLNKVLNTDNLQVTVKQVGKFMIKQSIAAENFTLNKVYPTIFTPNGDNRNDYVVFQYENPKDDEVSGKIYNVRGAYINTLVKSSDNSSLMWDGTKEGGKIAEPGVYVYQIEVIGQDAKVINGVIILAK
jgi:gliding motility-associated-like protein